MIHSWLLQRKIHHFPALTMDSEILEGKRQAVEVNMCTQIVLKLRKGIYTEIIFR